MILMLPEFTIIATALLVLALDLIFLGGQKKWLTSVAIAGVAVAALFTTQVMDGPSQALAGRFAMDALTGWFKLIFLLAAFLTLALCPEPFQKDAKNPLESRAEFLSVLLFTLSGMMFLISSRDLVTLYVSLELATIPLFALTAWAKTERSGEGAIKYLAMGALASAFLLYGLGILYGLTGEMSLTLIAQALRPNPGTWFAAALITAGIGFKLTLFPFHMWAPDAYQGAPTPVTAYLSVASKAAGVAIAFQLFYRVFGAFLPSWSMITAIVATATMTLGNVAAVRQNDLKRFMAYSAISQAGYVILGFMGNTGDGASSMVFYMLVYVLTNLAAFAILILHIHQNGGEEVTTLRGLSRTNPLLALAMMIALFGLAGIPPLSGFVGKFFLFSIAAKSGYYWLVAVAALNSTVSLYYYLRLVRQMYIQPAEAQTKPLRVSPLMAGGLGIATAGSVVCGVVPFFFERISAASAQWLSMVVH